MTPKRISQAIVVVAMLVASFASTGGVLAFSGCASFITVQGGDTLNSIAVECGITLEAIRAANPGLGRSVRAGQTLHIPTANTYAPGYYPVPTGGGTYVVQWGDTLGDIASRNGVSLNDMMAFNPQIGNASMIYPGQVLNLPGSVSVSPSTYYLPTYYQSSYPPRAESSQFSVLKVTYGHGLLVRTGPGMNFPVIHSSLVSAVQSTRWWYRKGSVTVDAIGFVWVEIDLGHMVNGYSTGWIMVKDSLDNYFTDPNIDP